jgi:lysophospholipase L1-like esterase
VWSHWWTGAAAVATAALVAALLSIPTAPIVPRLPGGQPAAAPGTSAGPGAHGTTAPAATAPATTVPATTLPSATAPAAAANRVPTGPVVALGDSYTAGDLMPLGFGGAPYGCLRSSNSYAVRVAKALGATAHFVDAACTNAGVKEMTLSQRTYLGTNPPQLNALAPDDSLVMLTIGGDDIGFLNVLDKCMELSLTDLHGSPCESYYSRGGTDQLAEQVRDEAAKLVTVVDDIRARAPAARVMLVGYPDMLPQQGGCWPVVPITDGDIGYLRGIETQYNAVLSGVAVATGATFVDTYTPTIGHDFCQSSKVKDVEGFVPTSLAAPFHPNARGQAAMAAAVLAVLRAGQAQPQAG